MGGSEDGSGCGRSLGEETAAGEVIGGGHVGGSCFGRVETSLGMRNFTFCASNKLQTAMVKFQGEGHESRRGEGRVAVALGRPSGSLKMMGPTLALVDGRHHASAARCPYSLRVAVWAR